MLKKEKINVTKEKIITFEDLKKLFIDNKENYIELSNKYNKDKYSIQINSNGFEGNLIINDKPMLHIIFYVGAVDILFCENDGSCVDIASSLLIDTNITEITDLIDTNFLNALTDYISNTVEKSITFEDLLKLFKDNKGKEDIILSETNYTYSIRIFDNMYYSVRGNFNIEHRANAQIEFKDNNVVVIPCESGETITKKAKNFKLDDDIMKMKDLLPNDYLTALLNYMRR